MYMKVRVKKCDLKILMYILMNEERKLGNTKKFQMLFVPHVSLNMPEFKSIEFDFADDLNASKGINI